MSDLQEAKELLKGTYYCDELINPKPGIPTYFTQNRITNVLHVIVTLPLV